MANSNADPCVTDRAVAAATEATGTFAVRDPEAATLRQDGLAAASARNDGSSGTVGGVPVTVGATSASRQAACVAGAVQVTGTSRVEGVTMAGVDVPIFEGEPFDVTVAGVRIRANQDSGDARQALVLEAPGERYTFGEARAGAASCDALALGDGGTRNGDLNTAGLCTPGSELDVARRVCVIRATPANGSREIVIGAPFEGPQSGRVVTLVEARRILALPVGSGEASADACLRGRGPRYAVLGTKGNDRITGTNRGDRVFGRGGKDSVDGGRGNDCLDGGAAGDVLSGGLGSDRQFGRAGNDHVNGGSNTDRLHGGAGNDSINTGYGRDTVRGGRGRDKINAATAGPASRLISCGGGFDKLRANRNERRVLRGCERRDFIR